MEPKGLDAKDVDTQRGEVFQGSGSSTSNLILAL